MRASGQNCVELAGDAVVEAGARAHDQVRLVHREVGLQRAVHAEHAEPLRRRGRKGAQAHQRQRAGRILPAHQSREGSAGGLARAHQAAAAVEDGTARGADHRPRRGRWRGTPPARPARSARRGPARAMVRAMVRAMARAAAQAAVRAVRAVRAGRDCPRPAPPGRPSARRSAPARAGPPSLRARRAGSSPAMASAAAHLHGSTSSPCARCRARRTPGRRWCRSTAVATWPLTHRSGIESLIASSRPDVVLAMPGPEVTKHHAEPPGRARIAFGRMHCRLLVAHQHVAQPRLGGERVVQGQHGAAGVAEDGVDAALDEGAQQQRGAADDRGGIAHLRRIGEGVHAPKSIGPLGESASSFQLRWPYSLKIFHRNGQRQEKF